MTARSEAVSAADVERLGDGEMRALLARRPVVLLPLGAVESHGDHLPAGTDTILARRLAERLVERVGTRVPLLLLPTLPFGQVWSLEDAPGSFSVSGATLTRTLVDLGQSCLAKGLRTIAVVNAHYGNAVAVRDGQRRVKEVGLAMAHLCYPGAGAITARVRERPPAHPAFMHACEIETSYMLHLAPEAVRMEAAIENYPAFPDDFGELPYRWSEFSDSPVLGDARIATADKGRAILEVVLDRMAEIVAALHARQDQASLPSQR